MEKKDSVKKATEILKTNNVRWVHSAFVDIRGILQDMVLPARDYLSGEAFTAGILNGEKMFEAIKMTFISGNFAFRFSLLEIRLNSKTKYTKINGGTKWTYNDFYFKLPLQTEPIIDDTTLRDGIQMPGLAVGPKESAKIAQLLEEIGVERIELFHYQEPDKKAVKLILDLNLDLRVAGWCRALMEDIDSAVACGFKEIGISHPVSDLHFKAKWPKKNRAQILADMVDVVEYAAKTCGLRTFVHGEDSTTG